MMRLSLRLFGRRGPPPGASFIRFDLARFYVQRLGLRNTTEWNKYSRTDRPSYIPSSPNRVYAQEWVSWYDFLGVPVQVGPGHGTVSKQEKAIASEKWKEEGFFNSMATKNTEIVESLLADLETSCSNLEFRRLPYQNVATIVYRERSSRNQPDSAEAAWIPVKIQLVSPSQNDFVPRTCALRGEGFDGLYIFVVDSTSSLHGKKELHCFTAYEFPWKSFSSSGTLYKVPSVEALAKKLLLYRKTSLPRNTYEGWSEVLTTRKIPRRSLGCLGTIMAEVFHPVGLHVEHIPVGIGANLRIEQFKAVWRIGSKKEFAHYAQLGHTVAGTLIPFDASDDFEFLLVIIPTTPKDGTTNQGFFLFPWSYIHKYCSDGSSNGKVQILVYPPSVNPKRKTSRAIQDEQLQYYYDVSTLDAVLSSRIKLRNFLAEANVEQERASGRSREEVLGLPVERMSVGM